jgi:NADH-quinone oxidoreductase subunit L
VHVSNGPSWLGLAIGALIAVAGIYTAYRIWVRDPAIAVNARERFPRVYLLLSNKWYFDELIDVVIVRPTLWLGGVITSVLERGLIQGLITGGPVAVVRAGSAAVRRSETGFVRYYAAAMVICTLGVALYFLVSSS